MNPWLRLYVPIKAPKIKKDKGIYRIYTKGECYEYITRQNIWVLIRHNDVMVDPQTIEEQLHQKVDVRGNPKFVKKFEELYEKI